MKVVVLVADSEHKSHPVLMVSMLAVVLVVELVAVMVAVLAVELAAGLVVV